jgi:hypothetical protein
MNQALLYHNTLDFARSDLVMSSLLEKKYRNEGVAKKKTSFDGLRRYVFPFGVSSPGSCALSFSFFAPLPPSAGEKKEGQCPAYLQIGYILVEQKTRGGEGGNQNGTRCTVLGRLRPSQWLDIEHAIEMGAVFPRDNPLRWPSKVLLRLQ